jgi:hypothetical protein
MSHRLSTLVTSYSGIPFLLLCLHFVAIVVVAIVIAVVEIGVALLLVVVAAAAAAKQVRLNN